ncbi:flagellar transcriptional activator (FlhC) [mine drainage metagenome]|uniref:Flagellar transcriptional activator (FlhC) n=1 Tax=mine drainage metagenome TaxID=410659 RepID=A0A1J5PEA6_9ZZZZ
MAREHPIATLVGGELARMGARSATIYAVLKSPTLCGKEITPARLTTLARQIHLEATGESSHPGLMPSATSWYFSSDRRIMHSSLILSLAWSWRHLGPEQSFVKAYTIYWRLTGGDRTDLADGRTVSADRAWRLVQQSLLPMQNWIQAKARGHTAATPAIRLLRCRSCTIPVIASSENLRVTCPVCRGKDQTKSSC